MKKTIKNKILKNIKDTYCRLQPSKIEGVGVFAIRNIPKGINPFTAIKKEKWIKFDTKEFKNLDKAIYKMIDDFFVIHKNGVVFLPVCGLNGINLSFFLNNSNKPNLKTIDDGENFITIRKIKKGEELTVSYATYDEKYIK